MNRKLNLATSKLGYEFSEFAEYSTITEMNFANKVHLACQQSRTADCNLLANFGQRSSVNRQVSKFT